MLHIESLNQYFLGPLMLHNIEKKIYMQLGIVAGGINFDQCGVENYPTVFSRLNHPDVLTFVKSVAENAGECFHLFIFKLG
jgi:hypothetical protein